MSRKSSDLTRTPTESTVTPPQPYVGALMPGLMRRRQPTAKPPVSTNSRSWAMHTTHVSLSLKLTSTASLSRCCTRPSPRGGAATGFRVSRSSSGPSTSARKRTSAPMTTWSMVWSMSSVFPADQKQRHSTAKGSLPLELSPAPSQASIHESDRSCSGRSWCWLKCGGCSAGMSPELSRRLNGRVGRGPQRSLGVAFVRCPALCSTSTTFQLNSSEAGG
mmetsp:Transcript_126187/g.356854  ORF Transcript_126187/g.356854 Transcript_126187/m.356854 type:complete len:219 (+) Transcript_126187:2737-3393(+)